MCVCACVCISFAHINFRKVSESSIIINEIYDFKKETVKPVIQRIHPITA